MGNKRRSSEGGGKGGLSALWGVLGTALGGVDTLTQPAEGAMPEGMAGPGAPIEKVVAVKPSITRNIFSGGQAGRNYTDFNNELALDELAAQRAIQRENLGAANRVSGDKELLKFRSEMEEQKLAAEREREQMDFLEAMADPQVREGFGLNLNKIGAARVALGQYFPQQGAMAGGAAARRSVIGSNLAGAEDQISLNTLLQNPSLQSGYYESMKMKPVLGNLMDKGNYDLAQKLGAQEQVLRGNADARAAAQAELQNQRIQQEINAPVMLSPGNALIPRNALSDMTNGQILDKPTEDVTVIDKNSPTGTRLIRGTPARLRSLPILGTKLVMPPDLNTSGITPEVEDAFKKFMQTNR